MWCRVDLVRPLLETVRGLPLLDSVRGLRGRRRLPWRGQLVVAFVPSEGQHARRLHLVDVAGLALRSLVHPGVRDVHNLCGFPP